MISELVGVSCLPASVLDVGQSMVCIIVGIYLRTVQLIRDSRTSCTRIL